MGNVYARLHQSGHSEQMGDLLHHEPTNHALGAVIADAVIVFKFTDLLGHKFNGVAIIPSGYGIGGGIKFIHSPDAPWV